MTLIQTVWKRGHSSSVHRRFFLAWTSHAAYRRPKRVMSRARVAQRSAQRDGPAACNHTQAIACTRLGRVLSLALLPSSSSGHHHHHHHHSPASHTHHHHHRSSSLPSRPLSSQDCSCTRRRSSVKGARPGRVRASVRALSIRMPSRVAALSPAIRRNRGRARCGAGSPPVHTLAATSPTISST